MKTITKFPILFISIAFFTGIVSLELPVFLGLFAAWVSVVGLMRKSNIHGTIVLVLFYFLGVGYYYVLGNKFSLETENYNNKKMKLYGVVVKKFSETPAKFLMEINEIYYLGKQYTPATKVYVRSKNTTDLFVGDTVLVFGKWNNLENAYGFNAYLLRKGVRGKFYSYKLKVLSHSGNILLKVKQGALNKFEDLSLGREIKAFIKALVLGEKSSLTSGTKALFSDTGTSHLLAVSGLHVGILLSFVFMFIRIGYYIKVRKKVLLLIAVVILWMFAYLVGFSASVLRAVSMTSVFILLYIFHKRTNIYNLIGLVMFVLLIWDCNIAFDIGFQLSFSAVLGIVYGYPQLKRLFVARNKSKIVLYLYDLTLVSISAQLFTLPITLYYFGSFPVYFLLSNILAIPLVFVIFYVAILWLLLGGLAFVSEGINYVLILLVKILFGYLEFINSLPYSKLEFDKNNGFLFLGSLAVVFAFWIIVYYFNKNYRKDYQVELGIFF